METIALAITILAIAYPIGIALGLFAHFYDQARAQYRDGPPAVTWEPPPSYEQAKHSARFLRGRKYTH